MLNFKDGNSVSYLKCGAIPGVYPTIDFGVETDVANSFFNQREYAKNGPLVKNAYKFKLLFYFFKSKI